MTLEAALLTGLLAGLFGSPHCLAMCGGIMAMLHGQVPRGRNRLAAGFHAGRLTSYVALAVLVSFLGWLPAAAFPGDWVVAVRVALGLVIVMLALYIAVPGRYRDFAGELVAPLTRMVMPLLARFVPADTWQRAVGLGLLWGLLPCGLLYAVLGAAWLLADPLAAALLVFGFGLGTIPLLAGGGLAVARFRSRLRHPGLRLPAAAMVATAGVLVAIGPWLAGFTGHDGVRWLVECVTPAI